MTEWRAEPGNYILINPDLMIFSRTLANIPGIHFTFYIILCCAMLALCVNESVYPSSLRSFNCCSKNKHAKYQHSGDSSPQRHAPRILKGLPVWCQHCLLITSFHNIMKMKCVREFPKWCNDGRWEQRLRWKIILQCTAAAHCPELD